jgi:hypothetical protein
VVAGPEVWLGCGAVTVTDVVTLTVRAGEHVLTPQVLGEDDITVAGAEGVGIPGRVQDCEVATCRFIIWHDHL